MSNQAPPDLTNTTLFPSFATLPTTPSPHILLATYKENMTIMRPTFILQDRQGKPFALTYMMPNDSPLRLKAKKGSLVAVVGLPKEEGKEEGQKGFVRVGEGDVGRIVVLGGLGMEELGAAMKGVRMGWEEGEKCVGCEKLGKKCVGCGWVRYCGKDCQTAGWTAGHKSSCKVFKNFQSILALLDSVSSSSS